MGNIMPYKIFEKNDVKKNINGKNENSIDKNTHNINKFLSEHMPTNMYSIEHQNKGIKENINNETNAQENKENVKNNENKENIEIEKIKEENFYLFDEKLDSNNIKHPCHAQWFLFWVFASYLNEKFTEQEKEDAHSFYSYFPDQCTKGKAKNCFSEFSKIYPIRAETREELMTWLQMCENYCRNEAHLPVKIFNYNKLLNRWRYDDEYA